MKVLVTGGYGFIGSYVCNKFFAEGWKVTIVDNLSSGVKANVPFKHTSYTIDVEDKRCDDIFRSGKFDVVVHLATQARTYSAVDSAHIDAASLLSGHMNLLKLAQMHGVKKFIYISSTLVYGTHPQEQLDEGNNCSPNTPAGLAHYLAEQCCHNWTENHGLDTVCLRVSEVYGPQQHTHPQNNMIYKLMKSATDGTQVTHYGNEEDVHDYIYVKDATDAIYRTANSNISGMYNLTSNSSISIKELFLKLANSLPLSKLEIISDGRGVTDGRYENTKLKEDLDWVPLYTLDEGIEITREAMQKVEPEQEVRAPKESKIYKKLSRMLPHLENVTAFLVVVLLTLGDFHYIDHILVDYNLIYIIMFGFFYGTQQSVLSIVLSSALFTYGKIVDGREVISLLFDSQYLITIVTYLFVGLFFGFMKDKSQAQLAMAKGKLQKEQERNEFIVQVFEDTCKVKDELRKQIINHRESLGKLYSITKELDSFHPESVYSAALVVLQNLTNSKKICIYEWSDGAPLFPLIKTRAHNIEFRRYVSEFGQEVEHILLNEKEIYINRELRSDTPKMIAPLLFEGKVIAIVMVEDVLFEYFTFHYENLFRIGVSMIHDALRRAYLYRASAKGERYTHSNILSERSMKEIMNAKNMVLQTHQVDYRLIHITNEHYVSSEMVAKINLVLKSTDEIGIINGRLVIVLSNLLPLETEGRIRSLHRLGLQTVDLDKFSLEERGGHIVYV